MEQHPWLSIIIPAYNAEQYLNECIASLELDSNSDIEVVIVDDGSTDSTASTCDRLQSRFLNLKVIHRANGGLPSARNAGCREAIGEWLWFVDSDDVVAPGVIPKLRKALEFSVCDIAGFQFESFDDHNLPNWQCAHNNEVKVDKIIGAYELLCRVYRGESRQYIWSYLFRKDALLIKESLSQSDKDSSSFGFPFREDFSLYEDVVSFEQIVRHIDRVALLNAVCYGYRVNLSSMSRRRSSPAAASGLKAVRELANYHVPESVLKDKCRMEMNLLFSAYKLVEDGEAFRSLKDDIAAEIDRRAKAIGWTHLGGNRYIRYFLFRTGLMDLIIRWRSIRV